MPTVLAIDDKQDNLVTLSALLKNLVPGCRVITAQSGMEGIEKAEAERPDVVLLDVKMPKMDGFETCQRLKSDEETKHIPVIMITAIKTDPLSRIRGLEIGANAFLSKPIDESELVSQVNVALRIKKAEDDLREERNSLEGKVQERTAALRESEERFFKAFQTSPYAITITRPEDGRFVEVNDAFVSITGFSRAEALSDSSIGLKIWADISDRQKMIAVLQAGRSVEGQECLFRTKGGGYVTGLFSAQTIRLSRGLFIFSSINDITLRRKEEEEKRVAQENAHQLAAEMALLAEIGRVISSSADIEQVYEPFASEVQKLIPFDNLMVNLHDRERNALIVTYVSGMDIPARRKGALIPFKGSTTEVIADTKRGLLLQPESVGEIVQEFPGMMHVFQAGLNSVISVPLISANRVIGVLVFRSRKKKAYTEKDLMLAERIGIQISGVIANAQLFSELKTAERALRESEERYRRITQSIMDYIYTVRVDQGRPVETSHGLGCIAVTGYSTEEFAADPYLWIRMVAPEDQPLVQDQAQRILSGTEAPVIEHRIRRKDGVERWIRNTSVCHRAEDGRLISYDGLVQDITDQKRAEEENLRLAERLQRAEKMEALGTLAGGVAHDLNNVLGIVVGYAGMLLDEVEETSPIRSNLTNILNGGERAAAIVQDLLTLARRGVSNRKVLNLSRMVADSQGSPEFKALCSYHPSVQIRIDLEPNLLNLSGSPVHIGKTLFNLVSNGCESMPNGGVLTIGTANQYIDRPIQGYDEVREGDYVVLSVSDTGEGIPADDLKRIFEPFYTKKVMGRSGTGLGLAVVWGTVKDHNGYINVQSEEGRGSAFTLYFPVTRDEITTDPAAVPVSEYMGRGESILIVDDVKGQRELAAAMLRKLNYRVSSVASGEEAVAHLQGHPADLLILDMIMDPGMDGLDTYRKVLEISPKQRAIIVSGFSESERVNAAQALGAGAYLKKPYVTERLGLAIRKELGRSA